MNWPCLTLPPPLGLKFFEYKLSKIKTLQLQWMWQTIIESINPPSTILSTVCTYALQLRVIPFHFNLHHENLTTQCANFYHEISSVFIFNIHSCSISSNLIKPLHLNCSRIVLWSFCDAIVLINLFLTSLMLLFFQHMSFKKWI